MLNIARNALTLYQSAHVSFISAPVPLCDLDGTNVGFVEHVEYCGGRVRITGWCLLDNLSIVSSSEHKRVRRRIHRGDVTTALGQHNMVETCNAEGRVGFSSELPWNGESIAFCSVQERGRLYWPLPRPSPAQVKAARRSASLSFAATAVRSLPLIVSYFAGGKRAKQKEALRQRFGILPQTGSAKVLSSRFFSPVGRSVSAQEITIIMPVYNAFELLEGSLSRIETNTDLPWHLIVVDDASPDSRVRPWLRAWASSRANQVTLLENEANLGFIGSVNRGLELASKRGCHVVLFNSDAFVPAGWASRLLRPILEDSQVASVTPMSNDATIFSVPSIAGTVQVEAGAVDIIDAVASSMTGDAKAVAPTGVGFCMAISRDALKHVPSLDRAFGRGYGEEVDWCQKIHDHGMINVGIGNLFVEHRGGQSFGSEAKLKSMAEAGRLIASRYPRYDADVQTFIKDDPLFTARLVLALAYATTVDASPLHIYLVHSLGGGATHWVNEVIRSRELEGKPTATIRIGGEYRFSIELHLKGDIIAGATDSPVLVVELLRNLPRRHVVYSCGVGDSNPIELPAMLCKVAGEEGGTLEVLFHDYFPISPSFNLMDSTNHFSGVPQETCNDAAHAPILADGSRGTLRDWRDAWTALMERADQITVFSNSSQQIVTDTWPNCSRKIKVQPHALIHNVAPLAPAHSNNGERVALGVLGSIGAVKGAQIVSDLARHLNKNTSDFDLVIIGEFDRSFSLPEDVVVTGPYQIKDLENLARHYRISAWWMPSIWPETFSFTTHEMLATGLPVIAFDIGAQGDAVRAAENGVIVEMSAESVFAAADALLTSCQIDEEEPVGSADGLAMAG